jgi:hypothetical protein
MGKKERASGRHAGTCPKCGTEVWVCNGQVKWYSPVSAAKKKAKTIAREEVEEPDDSDNDDEEEEEEELFP